MLRIAAFGGGALDDVPPGEFGLKAANLARVASLGVPVPPGFSLGVEACERFHGSGGKLPADVAVLLGQGMLHLEKTTGLRFGGARRPLLVSVRSGAPVSMPGLMDTILNVGLDRETLRGLVVLTGNPRFAWDSYRRLVEGFATTVFSQDPRPYRSLLREALEKEEISDERELDSLSLRELTEEYIGLFEASAGRKFPESSGEQLELAVAAVLRSWASPRVERLQREGALAGVRGTAVTVQAMVFGNTGLRSGAGVAFTRDPGTGAGEFLVDFRFGAQGEDVVSGERSADPGAPLAESLPGVHHELVRTGRLLEREFRDLQDIEFTVQEGQLYILQSRAGKRSPLAALRVAVDLWKEGLLTPAEALERLRSVEMDSLSFQRVASSQPPASRGVPASAGVATGRAALTNERAEGWGESSLLVKEAISPDDLPAIRASGGVLTARGARTSHAAVVARQMGKAAVVGCRELETEPASRKFRLGGRELEEGETLSLDGTTGAVYIGQVEVARERPLELLAVVEKWRREAGAKESPGSAKDRS